MDSILTQDLCPMVKKEVTRKEKQFNCFITLYMDTDPSNGCEMQVIFLDSCTFGGRKKIATTTNAAEVASGIIKYFKEVR